MFKNLKFVGEADILFIPIGFFLSNYNEFFFLKLFFWGMVFLNLHKKKSAMLFPIIFSSIF
jgi:hypothetical protein